MGLRGALAFSDPRAESKLLTDVFYKNNFDLLFTMFVVLPVAGIERVQTSQRYGAVSPEAARVWMNFLVLTVLAACRWKLGTEKMSPRYLSKRIWLAVISRLAEEGRISAMRFEF